MSYFNVFILLIVSFINVQEKHFVTFISDEVQIIHKETFTTVIIPFEILEGYHIQLEKVEDDNLLATKIDFENQTGIEVKHKEFISLQYKSVVLDKKEVMVLDNTFMVSVKLKLSPNKKKQMLKGKLFYQTCDNFKCYFPRELKFTISLEKRE